MERSPIRPRLQISARDISILQLVARFGYLRSSYLEAFLGGNPTVLRWRLRDLFDAEYLERPKQQWQFADARYVPLVYSLGTQGRQLLETMGTGAQCPVPDVGNYLHRLLVSEVAASIELGVQTAGYLSLIAQEEIVERMQETDHGGPHRLSFPIGEDQYIIPDAMFGVRGPAGVVLYALEVDRANEPLRRTSAGSSYERKLRRYDRLIGEGLYKRRLNTPAPLVVLHVAVTTARARGMMALTNALPFHAFSVAPGTSPFGQITLPQPSILHGPWRRPGLPDLALA